MAGMVKTRCQPWSSGLPRDCDQVAPLITKPMVLRIAVTFLVVLLGTLTSNLLLRVTISLMALRELVFRLPVKSDLGRMLVVLMSSRLSMTL